MSNGWCQSCRRLPATTRVDFGDGGPTYLVCRGCAEWATGVYVVQTELETGEEGTWA